VFVGIGFKFNDFIQATDHAQGFYALFAVVGLMLIDLLIWSV
jgi:hypothetical protein